MKNKIVHANPFIDLSTLDGASHALNTHHNKKKRRKTTTPHIVSIVFSHIYIYIHF